MIPVQTEGSDIRKFILSSSKGLAEVTKSKTPTVQFIHESVRDFLLKEKGFEEIWSDLGRNFQGESHERLKQCCLGYMTLCFDGLKTPNLPAQVSSEKATEFRQSADKAFPLLEYAVRNILYHADAAEGSGVSQTNFLQTFQLAEWIERDNLFERHAARRHTQEASFLYLFAEYNLLNLIECHPSDNQSCFRVERERYGPPIFAAMAMGNVDAVCSLLKIQAASKPLSSRLHDLHSQYAQGKNKPLGLSRDFKFTQKRGLLSYIAERGDEAFLAVILALDNNGLNIELKSNNGRTPLSYAAQNGSEAVVRLLLDRGANLESVDRWGRTPLWYAAGKGNEDVVRLLLNSGANADSTGSLSWTPLLSAAGIGTRPSHSSCSTGEPI